MTAPTPPGAASESERDALDPASKELTELSERQHLIELLFEPEALALADSETMAGAWRTRPARTS